MSQTHPQEAMTGSSTSPSAPDSRRRPGPLARLSIEQKVPLIAAGLLLAVVATLDVAAYKEVRTGSLRTAADRLTSLSSQFRDAYVTSGVQLRSQIAATASKQGVVAFARTPNARNRARALEDMKYSGPNPATVLAAELRDAEGKVLLSSAPGLGFDSMRVGDVLPRNEGDSGVVGRFRLLRDTIVFAVAAPVPGTDIYAVRWRRVVGNPRSREALTRLMGSRSVIHLGSAGDSIWTNLEGREPAPPRISASGPPIQTYERAGERYIAGVANVTGTPWSVVVDVPLSSALANADSFVWRMVLISLVALALALFGANIMSRRLTRPLGELTDAAGAIASGDFTHDVRIARDDELGQLGSAFAAMASEVRSTREGLERKVQERTRDVNDALNKLHDAQDALVRRERLAMLGQLASGVGHELRNPLGVMTNAIYYLRMVLGESPENVKEYLGILQQQVTLSEKIVSDLLDFARQKPPQRKPTSLLEVSKQQVARLGLREGVEIDSNLNGTLPAVLVDEVQLGQIILNLLTNAVQAMEGEGSITIRGRVDIDRVLYEVTDTGPGVPPENLEKIFEPLFTTKARGIGLGLAVSRTLARANGGDLSVRNEPGKGATFRLHLALATAAGTKT